LPPISRKHCGSRIEEAAASSGHRSLFAFAVSLPLAVSSPLRSTPYAQRPTVCIRTGPPSSGPVSCPCFPGSASSGRWIQIGRPCGALRTQSRVSPWPDGNRGLPRPRTAARR